jgi:hypothetical protein
MEIKPMSKRTVESFVDEIIACGFVHELDEDEDERDAPDFDGFAMEDVLRLEAQNIQDVAILRQSEFYFVLTLKMKDGSHLYLEQPINKWMIRPAKKAA